MENAIVVGEILAAVGFAPYIPHLSHFWDQRFVHEYKFWMRLDDAYLSVCEAVYHMPGESKGADTEVARAKALGIPVFTNMLELMEWDGEKDRRLGEGERHED